MSAVVRSSPTLSRARLLTVIWLVSTVLSVVLLPLNGVAREPSALLRASGLLGVGVLLCAQLLVMWSAVTPWATVDRHRRTQVLFVIAAVASVPLVAPVGAARWSTWAWLGASVIGIAPLLWGWATTALAALVVTSTSVAVALLLEGEPVTYVAITLGIGGGLALVNWTPVWLWELLVRADAMHQAGVRAAAASERNRFGADVHDILGHDLTVIALKSELAARTVATDPASSARESEEVRALAEAALGRIRGALAVRRAVDVRAEVEEVARVLTGAGLQCEATAHPVAVAPPVADALAMVLKEAVTNVLRHSDAQRCRIRLAAQGEWVRLSIANDRPRPAQSQPGSGLVGLRHRLAAVGAELSIHRDDASFEVRATAPVDRG